MNANKNRQILLISRPAGMPTEENFKLIETDIPQPGAGEVLVRSLYLSVDPYMRGRMSTAKSYVAPYELNAVITGGVVGEIVASNNEKFAVGDIVRGSLGWADFNISSGTGLSKLDPNLAPITTSLGVAGMPGLTAYFGLLDIGNPQPGETVVVSGAAGAVGTVVGQIAKLTGCRVVGIAGSDEKNEYLVMELGFDVAINYKTQNVYEALKDACPNGIDVYFDNVGGSISDAVMPLLNFQARIPLCGQISLYNAEKAEVGPRILPYILKTSSLLKGFIVNDYAPRFREAVTQLSQWIAEGKLKYRENIIEGLENTPRAFLGLFHGENMGKQLVKVADVNGK